MKDTRCIKQKNSYFLTSRSLVIDPLKNQFKNQLRNLMTYLLGPIAMQLLQRTKKDLTILRRKMGQELHRNSTGLKFLYQRKQICTLGVKLKISM